MLELFKAFKHLLLFVFDFINMIPIYPLNFPNIDQNANTTVLFLNNDTGDVWNDCFELQSSKFGSVEPLDRERHRTGLGEV